MARQAPPRQDPSPEALPSETLVSVSFDGWVCAMATLFAAHLIEDHACVTKQAFRLLGLLESLMTALPMVTNFGIFFAATLDGEHATVKKRHSNGPLPEAAWVQLEKADAACKTGKIEDQRSTHREIKTSLCQLLSTLPVAFKSEIRWAVVEQLLLTLERENNKFPKLASSSIWYRIADEDAHGIPKWGCPIYLIVSGNGDSFMANCHCANDRQVVYQLVVRGDGQLVVRNARALKAAIFQSLFPDLAHYPEAWWSQSPAAVNFQEPAEEKVWLLMMLIELLHGKFVPDHASKTAAHKRESKEPIAAKGKTKQHVIGVQGLASLLAEWLKSLNSDSLPPLCECFAWLLQRRKPGVVRYLAKSQSQLAVFCEARCRAFLTAALQATTRLQGNGWEEGIQQLGEFLGVNAMALAAEVLVKDVATTNVTRSGSMAKKPPLCLRARGV